MRFSHFLEDTVFPSRTPLTGTQSNPTSELRGLTWFKKRLVIKNMDRPHKTSFVHRDVEAKKKKKKKPLMVDLNSPHIPGRKLCIFLPQVTESGTYRSVSHIP